ncbi:hypothetical protein SISNIDRAFT_397073, partial [Sistotremastrum niveocremeum HHB9708]
DGHNSHVSIEFVKFCKEHGIELACFPSHATGFLQPLDVGIFGPLSHAWSEVLTNEMTGGVHIRKQDFTRLYAKAWVRAFNVVNILIAFKATGIHPFD